MDLTAQYVSQARCERQDLQIQGLRRKRVGGHHLPGQTHAVRPIELDQLAVAYRRDLREGYHRDGRRRRLARFTRAISVSLPARCVRAVRRTLSGMTALGPSALAIPVRLGQIGEGAATA